MTELPLLKPSRYNYATQVREGVGILFNFYTLDLIELGSPVWDAAERLLSKPGRKPHNAEEEHLFQTLVEGGFLVEEELDERELLRAFNDRAKTASAHLSLTVVPTLRCNFSCSYCYQAGIEETMTAEVEQALVAHVRENVKDDGSLSVTWFGGEPLLCFPVIERLSKAFVQECTSRKATYSAEIITNGYLLDGEMSERLREFNVTKAQVTIDGPPDVHNRRRPHKTGVGTYERLVRNVRDASNYMKVDLRMNVDGENAGRISEFLDILVNEGLERRTGFYLGQTYPYTSACSNVRSTYIPDGNFSLLGLRTAIEMIEKGFSSHPTLRAVNCHCMADAKRAYVVTPGGHLAKCWNDVSNPGAAVGHLTKPFTPEMKKNVDKWDQRDPFQLECKECLLLPVCMGGCPYLYLLNGYVSCHSWKHHVEESLRLYHLLKKMERESDIISEFDDVVSFLKAQRKRGQESAV